MDELAYGGGINMLILYIGSV